MSGTSSADFQKHYSELPIRVFFKCVNWNIFETITVFRLNKTRDFLESESDFNFIFYEYIFFEVELNGQLHE